MLTDAFVKSLEWKLVLNAFVTHSHAHTLINLGYSWSEVYQRKTNANSITQVFGAKEKVYVTLTKCCGNE